MSASESSAGGNSVSVHHHHHYYYIYIGGSNDSEFESSETERPRVRQRTGSADLGQSMRIPTTPVPTSFGPRVSVRSGHMPPPTIVGTPAGPPPGTPRLRGFDDHDSVLMRAPAPPMPTPKQHAPLAISDIGKGKGDDHGKGGHDGKGCSEKGNKGKNEDGGKGIGKSFGKLNDSASEHDLDSSDDR